MEPPEPAQSPARPLVEEATEATPPRRSHALTRHAVSGAALAALPEHPNRQAFDLADGASKADKIRGPTLTKT